MVCIQGVFEGLKAYRTEDGRILLFRPEQNALRMQMGADRLRMPSPTIEQFVDAVKHTVVANKQWVIIYKYFITMIYKSHDIYWKMLLIIDNLYKNIRTLLIINLLLNSKPYCVQGSSMRIVLCLRQFYVLICMYACMYVLRPHKYITYL